MPINIDGSKGIRQNTTEVTKIPVGTTAQRPANPEAGMIRFNTDQGFVEGYDPVTDEWRDINKITGVVASGGTVTDITQDGQLFRVHTFTSDGTFEAARGGEVEYLVVGGGGGAGDTHGGGGGAGGLLQGQTQVFLGSFNVVVGGGGIGGRRLTLSGGRQPESGGNSSIFGIVSQGGARGGKGFDDVQAGFSGGNGSGAGASRTSGQVLNGGAGNQGFSGGNSVGGPAGEARAGGGGGAGGNGTSGSTSTTGNGGSSINSSITGTSVAYAGGGGGGSDAHGDSNGGGAGAGGGAGVGAGESASIANRGSGGGGGGGSSGDGGSGSSGVVIVRYRIG